jgi:hypothetical protein
LRLPWRDILLLFLGIAVGYVVAVVTRAGAVPALQPLRRYVMANTTEVFVGLILLGIIVYLMGNKKR